LLERAEKEYVSQWQMACSKQKWTSIAKVPDLSPTTVKILTHLISLYQLPLMEYSGVGGKLIHEKNQKQKIS
jgi:hypothetical protein